MTTVMTVDEFFTGCLRAREVYDALLPILDRIGPYQQRITRSQIAFRRHRGFAYLWIPGRYLRLPTAPVVLSIALDRPDPSPRFKQVVHPASHIWMHHLELHRADDLDETVTSWLRRAHLAATPGTAPRSGGAPPP